MNSSIFRGEQNIEQIINPGTAKIEAISPISNKSTSYQKIHKIYQNLH